MKRNSFWLFLLFYPSPRVLQFKDNYSPSTLEFLKYNNKLFSMWLSICNTLVVFFIVPKQGGSNADGGLRSKYDLFDIRLMVKGYWRSGAEDPGKMQKLVSYVKQVARS